MKHSLTVLSYDDLKKEAGGSSKFKKLRASFLCHRNPDVENFIHMECSKYEKDFNTRNYFIFDTEKLEIAAFFTLSLHSIILADLFSSLNEETMSTLRGYGKRDARSVGCYLIGQLARNDSYENSDISGDEILAFAKDKLIETRDIVGGRFVAIDCAKELIPFYERNGFVTVNQHADLFTMVMPITSL